MKKCKHLNRRNIFGDENNAVPRGHRQRCTDCGIPLNKSLDPKGLSGQRFQDTDALLNLIDEILSEVVD